MLTQRLTSVFKVVSKDDAATLEIPTKLMSLYVQKRDFSLIEGEIKKLGIKPTIFYCHPLKAEKEYLADSILTDGSAAFWQIFRHHVTKADHLFAADGSPLVVLDDDGLVSKDSKEKIPRDVVQEIATVIIHKANESTKPFTMPDTWLQTRIRSQALHAAIAQIEDAKEKNTE